MNYSSTIVHLILFLAVLLLKGCYNRCYLSWIKRLTEQPDFYILLLNIICQRRLTYKYNQNQTFFNKIANF